MKYNIYLLLGVTLVIGLGFYIYKLKSPVNQNKLTQIRENKPEPLYKSGDVIGNYEVVLGSDIYPYHYLVKFVGYYNVYLMPEDSLKILKNEKK